MLCISTSKRMLAHAFTWSKMMKIIGKLWKKYLFHHAHKRRMWDVWRFCVMHMSCPCTERTKKNKILNEQPGFGCQPAFKSHSQSLTNKLFSSIFFMILTWTLHTHDGKGTFSWFLNVFHRFRPCECMRKHAFAGQNTQQRRIPQCLQKQG